MSLLRYTGYDAMEPADKNVESQCWICRWWRRYSKRSICQVGSYRWLVVVILSIKSKFMALIKWARMKWKIFSLILTQRRIRSKCWRGKRKKTQDARRRVSKSGSQIGLHLRDVKPIGLVKTFIRVEYYLQLNRVHRDDLLLHIWHVYQHQEDNGLFVYSQSCLPSLDDILDNEKDEAKVTAAL